MDITGEHGDLPSVTEWVNFRPGPRSGDRAPQGECLLYPSMEEATLFKQFRGTAFILLLFDGRYQSVSSYRQLVEIARRVRELAGGRVNSFIVVGGREKPAQLEWDGPILLDPGRSLHRLYSASAPSLCLVRPDWYIGFRSQPIAEEPFIEYLGRVFARRYYSGA